MSRPVARRALSRRPTYAASTTPTHVADDATLAPDDSISAVAERRLPPVPRRLGPPAPSELIDSAAASPADSAYFKDEDDQTVLLAPPQRVRMDDDEWRRRMAATSHGVTRQVELTRGHYCADFAAPPAVVNAVERRWLPAADRATANEMTRLRYSAVDVDPADFVPANGWRLRQNAIGRETELVIAVSAFNESRNLLARTLHGIAVNIRDMIRHSGSGYWAKPSADGSPAWTRIVLCLVFDGMDALDKTALDTLATLGAYQEGLMRREIDGKETVAHLFESTTQLSLDVDSGRPRLVVPAPEQDRNADNLFPMQLAVLIKQRNSKKINTHRWVFDAVCRQLSPTVVCLIDVGTRPERLSIYQLWRAFHADSNVAGACGELTVDADLATVLLNPLVAAQRFEYKISNHLTKPLEAAVGYISVLCVDVVTSCADPSDLAPSPRTATRRYRVDRFVRTSAEITRSPIASAKRA